MSDLYAFLGAQQNGQQLEQQDRNNQYRQRQEQRFDRQEQRQGVADEENRAMNHLNFVANMVKMGGAPVNSDGIINKMLAMPSQLPANGPSGAGIGFTPQMSVERQADPGRTVGLLGRPQYELPTQEEFFQDQLRVQRINANQAGAIGYGQLIRKLQAESHFKGEQEREAARIKEASQVAEVDRSGGYLPEPIRTRFSLPEGRRYSSEEVKRYTDAFNAGQPKQSTPHWETNDKGVTTAITLDANGKPVAQVVGPYGKTKTQPAGDGAPAGANDPLVMAVMANPAAFDNLTPTERTRIIPALQAAGFQGFGRALGEGAIDRLSDGDAALNSINALTKTLETNNANVGPIIGRITGANPYSDMQSVQAEVDLVRQRVGKAFEGGVLRKEDELKYMKILPTMNDTPENAIKKARMVATMLSNDLSTYRETQRSAGRRVSDAPGQRPASSGTRPPLSSFEVK